MSFTHKTVLKEILNVLWCKFFLFLRDEYLTKKDTSEWHFLRASAIWAHLKFMIRKLQIFPLDFI